MMSWLWSRYLVCENMMYVWHSRYLVQKGPELYDVIYRQSLIFKSLTLLDSKLVIILVPPPPRCWDDYSMHFSDAVKLYMNLIVWIYILFILVLPVRAEYDGILWYLYLYFQCLDRYSNPKWIMKFFSEYFAWR